MHNKRIIFLLIIIVAGIVLNSCKNSTTPKPRGYFRIEFPEKDFTSFEKRHPFSFEYPVYANVLPDNTPNAEPHWLNIEVNKHKATIHISYKPVMQNLHLLTEESRNLAYKHALKASVINEQLFINHTDMVYGTIYEIKGNAASPMQFHLTDSTKHFLRGSFYISEIPNYDSLRPVIEFLQQDIYHLIETFNWE